MLIKNIDPLLFKKLAKSPLSYETRKSFILNNIKDHDINLCRPKMLGELRRLHFDTNGKITNLLWELSRNSRRILVDKEKERRMSFESDILESMNYLTTLKRDGCVALDCGHLLTINEDDYSSEIFLSSRDRGKTKARLEDLLCKKTVHQGRYVLPFHKIKSKELKAKLLSLTKIKPIDNIQRHYLGAPGYLDCLDTWRTLPTLDANKSDENKSSAAQYFHIDYTHVKFLKCFYAISNIKKENGPFEFIKSSHSMMMSNKDGWINDDIVYKSIKKENIFVGTGSKGTTTIADTQGIHKASEVKDGHRMVIVFQYNICNWGNKTNIVKDESIFESDNCLKAYEAFQGQYAKLDNRLHFIQ